MTASEFNKKYEKYLEQGHYGLDIHIESVINYLDSLFPDIIRKYPDFSYSQIKLKFNMARFYCQPLDLDSSVIEDKIDELVKEYDLNKKKQIC
jgi:hypothetical protein